MFLVDDLICLPARGLMALFREVQHAADEEIASEAQTIRSRLCDLYMLLETRQITEEEFDRREHELLERLEAIESRQALGSAAGAEDESDAEQADVPGADEESDGKPQGPPAAEPEETGGNEGRRGGRARPQRAGLATRRNAKTLGHAP